MKKLTTLLLMLALLFGICGCSQKHGQAAKNMDQSEATSGEDVYNVVMQIVTFGQEYEGLDEVESAINDITVPEIGVSVTLNPVKAWDLASTSVQQISSGEKLDLMCVLAMGSGLDNIGNYAGRNLLLPLDELYNLYGQDIDCCIGELKQLGYYGGTLYGVPVNYLAGTGGGYIVRTDLMEELGFQFKEGKTYSLEDLEPMFSAYQEVYGYDHFAIASHPMQSVMAVDMLGDGSSGVLLNGGLDNLEVINLFASQAYESYANSAYDWNQRGYFHPNAAYITDAWPQLIAQGNYLGAFVSFNGTDGTDGMPAWENNSGYDLTAIKIIDDIATTQIASYATWCIPVTCENPEKTMQFLNLLYQDREREQDIDSLLATGIEGITYQVVEEVGGSKAIVTYADGVDYISSPYEQTVPIYGNQLTVPKFEPLTSDIYNQFAGYNQNLRERGRYSRAFGYAFDATSVSAERAAVQKVISQYTALLAYGIVNPHEVLPEFLQELEDAGIDTVIAENQRQLDAWISQDQ